jgi:uncharacterized GH25 family protein
MAKPVEIVNVRTIDNSTQRQQERGRKEKGNVAMLRLALAASLALVVGVEKGNAHEFWISPETYRAVVGDAVVADLRLGEDFRGIARGFEAENFERFEIVTSDGTVPVEARNGAIPALNAADLPEGLAVIVHETTPRELTWNAWERFAAFAESKGLGDVATMQDERGLDRLNVRESYIRYAKSLVAVGHGHGADIVVGLRAELVALANPYVDDLVSAFPVQLWLDGEPCPASQVEVYARPAGGGTSELTLYETDGNGIAVITVEPGMEYLVNAVRLEPVEVEPDSDGPEWRTLWASLTFEVPSPEVTQ